MNVALDTNLLVYAEGGGRIPADELKRTAVWSLVERLTIDGANLFLPIQVLLELQHVLTRKKGLSKIAASDRAKSWLALATPIATGRAVFDHALRISGDHQLQIFDAVILAAAAEAKCERLLSEDLQHGFRCGGVEIVNPFS